MSDYLINLARRSTGLAPLPHAPNRPANLPRAIHPPAPPTAPGPDTRPRVGDAMPTIVAPRVGPQRDDPPPRDATQATGRQPTPQPPDHDSRLPISTPPWASAGPQPARAESRIDLRPVNDNVETKTVARPNAGALQAHPVAPPDPIATLGPNRVAQPAERTTSPGPLSEPDPEAPQQIPLATPAPQPEAADPTAPVIQATQGDSPAATGEIPPLQATTGPVPVAPVRQVTTAQSPPRRDVHVRIGTIEINSAAAPSAPPPAPAPPPASTGAGGFDAFSALRTYAPWDR